MCVTMAGPGRHTSRVRIYLMWARGTRIGAGLEPEVVARSLQDVLAPLFTAPPPVAIEANAAWRGIEFEHDLQRAARRARREADAVAAAQDAGGGGNADTGAGAPSPAERDWRPSTGKQYCDYDLYWDEVGGPLVDRLTRDDGPWTDVFDAARVRSAAGAPPVEVALVALAAEALGPADA
jgi:hypothetical protein